MTSHLIVYEDNGWRQMLPLTYSRATFELICGYGTLLGRIKRLAEQVPVSVSEVTKQSVAGDNKTCIEIWCRSELRDVISGRVDLRINGKSNCSALLLNGRGFWKSIPEFRGSESWVGTTDQPDRIACLYADAALMRRLDTTVMQSPDRLQKLLESLPRVDVGPHVRMLDWPWEIVQYNGSALREDWQLAARTALPESDPPGVFLLNRDAIHIGRNTVIKPSVVLDASDGPIWIGDNVTIHPHVAVQGPAFVGPDCTLNAGCNLRKGTSLGPHCKVGGEVEASIIQGFSNKQHDGFLGHSCLGSWVNIGAGCSNSDLKNTYSRVRVPIGGRDVQTGETFVGMTVGDHVKTAVNVSIPTGAVIGFCSNIICRQCPKFVHSFSWAVEESTTPNDLGKAIQVARRMMKRRNQAFTVADERLFNHIARQAKLLENSIRRKRRSQTNCWL